MDLTKSNPVLMRGRVKEVAYINGERRDYNLAKTEDYSIIRQKAYPFAGNRPKDLWQSGKKDSFIFTSIILYYILKKDTRRLNRNEKDNIVGPGLSIYQL